MNSSAPWDRTPVAVYQSAESQLVGGAGTTTQWTYTVPTGRRLFVSHASVVLRRVTNPTTPNVCHANIATGGYSIVKATLYGSLSNAIERSSLSGGPLVLPPGTVLTASGTNYETGGDIRYEALLSGFLFDV